YFQADFSRLLCQRVDHGKLTLVEDHQGQSTQRPGREDLVTGLLEEHQALLEPLSRRCQIPASESDVGQMKGGVAHPLCVSDLSKQRQTLLTQSFPLLDVAQGSGQAPSSPQGSGT